MEDDSIGSPPAGTDSATTPAQPDPENAASAPLSKPKSRRGGKRRGSGRPSAALQMERADKAAEAVVERLRREADPERAMEQILGWHTDQFEQQIARGKFGSPQKAAEHARAILAIARELLPFRKPKLAAVAMQSEVQVTTVIRAPEPCKTTQEWIEKYGRKSEAQQALGPPSPIEQKIIDGVEQEEERRMATEMAQREADWAAQNPPLASPVSDAPPTEIDPHFWGKYRQ